MKRVSRPCDECPWRTDSEPGRFDPERWDALRATDADDRGFGPEFGAPLFACHKTPEGGERVCAGWLATCGAAHPNVRLAVLTEVIPATALRPAADWPPLFPTVNAAANHDQNGPAHA